MPDESIPLDAMQLMDLVWVQFYNNPPCNLDGPNFLSSFREWSKNLSKNGKGPRLYVGAPGCPVPGCSGSAYVRKEGLRKVVQQAKEVSNFGGLMFWEGSRAKLNGDYLKTAKEALAS